MKATFIYFVSLFMIATVAYGQTKKDSTVAKWPKASIAGKTGEMTKDELLNAKGLEMISPAFKVIEFRMSIVGKGVAYQEIPTLGSELNDKMRAAIKEASSGTKLFFEYIKCTDENNEIHLVSPFTVILK
jgi:Zn-dependent membrane protease YugP